MQLLRGKGLVDHALRGSVHARIGNRVEPMSKRGIQVVKVAERAGGEEVFTDIPIWPLDLALGLGPVGTAGSVQVSNAGMTGLSACGCDRRPKSAKARNRGGWGPRCGGFGLWGFSRRTLLEMARLNRPRHRFYASVWVRSLLRMNGLAVAGLDWGRNLVAVQRAEASVSMAVSEPARIANLSRVEGRL
jgi:hypothetical protein